MVDYNQLALDAIYQAWRYYFHFDNNWDDYKWDSVMKELMKNRHEITDPKVKWIFDKFEDAYKDHFVPSLFFVKENEFAEIFNDKSK